ncbi:MAG TPA: DUF4189 domain-containing protein [Hyphomicrobiaceae bacterium]|nr:DUF4189 domain-containing protein [Hyphomicrobiaceae bacterium]
MRAIRMILAGTLALAAAVAGVAAARADAALAVGQPADVAKQGVAVGWAVDYLVGTEAEKEALARCRDLKDAVPAAREACRIVETFRDTCLVVALDPGRGTTGIGWAVHKNADWAEDAAIEKCESTSAPARRASCRVALTRCDGH